MSTLSQFFGGGGGGGLPDLEVMLWEGEMFVSKGADVRSFQHFAFKTNANLAAVDEWENLVNITGGGVFHGAMIHGGSSHTCDIRVSVDGRSPVTIAKGALTNRAHGANVVYWGVNTDTQVYPIAIPTGWVRFNNSLLIERRSSSTNSFNTFWAVHYSLDA